MKSFKLLMLLSVLFVAPYAFAQPPCPCDDLELSNGNTGAEIVDILCPGGHVAPGNLSTLTPDLVEVIRTGGEKLELGYGVGHEGDNFGCGITEETVGDLDAKLTEEEYEDCRVSLIARCGLLSHDIPTLSEWGMIAMAGVLGGIGIFVASRRRKAAV